MNNAALGADAMLEQMNRNERHASTAQRKDIATLKLQIEASQKLREILDAGEHQKTHQNEVHPQPEHWFWRWPCWSFLTGSILFFAVHIIVGLVRAVN